MNATKLKLNRIPFSVKSIALLLACVNATAIGQQTTNRTKYPGEPQQISPVRYEVIDLGTLDPNWQPGDNTSANAVAINEHGDVAGVAEDGPWPFGDSHPFIYDYALGEMFAIDEEDSGGSAKGLNDNGMVVGWWGQPVPDGGPGGTARPFIYGPNTPMYDPMFPIGFQGESWGINNSGQAIAGVSGNMYIIDPDGTITEFGLANPQNNNEFPWEINNNGIVTGVAIDDFFQNCFSYDSDSGVLTNLHQERWDQSVGYGLNDRGDIVGFSIYPTNWQPATVWAAEGDIIEFGVQRWGEGYVYVQAEHINMQGDVVGSTVSFLGEPAVGWVAFDVLHPRHFGVYTDPHRPAQFLLMDLISPEQQLVWTGFQCFEINDARQITGIGVINGQAKAFLADPVPAIKGDFNLDGTVNYFDAMEILKNMGKRGARPLEGDANRDRVVDVHDLIAFASEYISNQNAKGAALRLK